MELVQSIPVTVYKDEKGIMCSAGSTRHIDCTFSKVKDTWISTTAGGNDCKNWAAGDEWENGVAPEGVEAVQVVKISTPKGFLWIAPASYTSLLDACNACCTE